MDITNNTHRRNGIHAVERELSRSNRRRVFFCLAAGVLGVAISWLLAEMLREQELRFTEAQFRHDAEKRIEAIERVAVDQLSVIDVLAAFFAGSELVERAEFQTFSAPLFGRFQGVQVLGWAPLIAEGARTAHEQTVRDEGFENYRITQRDGQGRYVPAGERAEYCPILFVEPFEKFRSLQGYDFCSEPACRAAIRKASATGRQAAAVCTQQQKEKNGRLFVVFEPIYGPMADTIAAGDSRRPIGFVFGTFDVDSLVDEALGQFVPAGIDITIREYIDAGGGDTVYVRPAPLRTRKGDGEDTFDPFGAFPLRRPVVGVVKAADRRGEVVCVPTEAYEAQYRTWLPSVVLFTGLMITVLLTGLMYLLTGRTAHVRRLIAQRTVELRASEQRFRRLVENAGDAVFLHDLDGRIVDVNRRACDSLGYARDELLAMNVSDIDVYFFEGNLAKFYELPDHEYPVTIGGVHRRKNGETFPVEVRLVSMYSGNRRLMLGLARDVTEHKLAEEKLRKEQRLLRELLDLLERERKLTAYEIHDGLAQQLTGATMKLQTAEHLWERDPAAARKTFDDAAALLREAMSETRRLIGGLRPPVLDESGVAAAVEVLIYSLRKTGAPEIEFRADFAPQRFAPPVESAVFRIVQESLTNACRYSRSEKIRVELGLDGDRLTIDVRDWGVGFDPENIPAGHFGIRGIRERARLLDGSAAIESAPEQGTRVRVELPLLQPVQNGNGA